MTAVVLLDAVWVNSALDPSDAMSFVYAGDAIKVSSKVNADAQAMAGGRVRLVQGTPGTSWSASLTLPWVTPDQRAWLDAHAGTVVCLRDHQGTKLFGFYAEVPVSESTLYRDKGDVELSFAGVTFSEAT